jgi:hypothetical protein
MLKQPFATTIALIAILLAPAFSGCAQPVADSSDGETQDSLAQTDAGSSAPQKDVATQPNTLPEKDASAAEVCKCFLSLLAQDERTLAEQLLTRRAFKVTVDAGLELEPMGGKNASLKVGEAVYATSRAEVAQVPCTVTEKNGKQQTLTWMMRRGDSGWRIAGLILNSGKSPEFLSLENKADVAAMMGPAESGTVRQVSATSDE